MTEPNPYELDLPDDPTGSSASPVPLAAPSTHGRCPQCNIVLRPGAVLCLNCGLNLATGERLQPRVATADDPADGVPEAEGDQSIRGPGPGAIPGADRWANAMQRARLQEDLAEDQARLHYRQERVLPLAFLAAGLGVTALNAFVLLPATPGSFGLSESAPRTTLAAWMLLISAVFFVLQVPCLFVGILLVSKLYGVAFGEILAAIRKLAVLALLCGAFHTALGLGLDILLNGFGFVGWMFKAAASFTLFWSVSKTLFDELEAGECVVLWIVMIMMPVFLLVVAYLAFGF